MHVIDAYMIESFGDAEWPNKQTLLKKCKVPDLPSLDWDRVVAVHGPQTHPLRTFSKDYWQCALKALIKCGFYPVLLGSQKDLVVDEDSAILDLQGQTTIHQAAAIIQKAGCFLGSDSGLFHVAGTTATPIVALFTNVLPLYRIPWRNGSFGWMVKALMPSLSCVGCTASAAWPDHVENCSRGDLACVGTHAVTVDMILAAVRGFMAL
jgi:ADP-heptose:LPS heptosyltransferase